MKPGTRTLLIIAILLLAAIACTTVMGPVPTDTPAPTNTPLPTPTEEITPEKLATGVHYYHVSMTESDCDLSLSSNQQYREIYFSDNQAQIKSTDSEMYYYYDQIEPHRYMRINDANKPIVAEFNLTGFFLQIYLEGADPLTEAPCGFFTFTLIEE